MENKKKIECLKKIESFDAQLKNEAQKMYDEFRQTFESELQDSQKYYSVHSIDFEWEMFFMNLEFSLEMLVDKAKKLRGEIKSWK